MLNKEQIEKLQTCRAMLRDIMSDEGLYETCMAIGSVKSESPIITLSNDAKSGKYDELSEESYQQILEACVRKAEFWGNSTDIVMSYDKGITTLLSQIPDVLYQLDWLLKIDAIQERCAEIDVEYADVYAELDETKVHNECTENVE